MIAQSAIDYARRNQQRFLRELGELLAIPSVSAQPGHAQDVVRAAQYLAWHCKRAGLDNAALIPTAGHPLVYGDWLHAPGKPTILVYGHYDVQPADPLAAWNTPPFEPTHVNGHIVARGAADNKGPTMALLKGIESMLKATGTLPVNVRVVIEGEEECAGSGLDSLLQAHPERFACDAVLLADSEMFAPDTPTLTLGLRGVSAVELEARGASADLHSGLFGGVAPNALLGLTEVIGSLRDKVGRVLIPGFYDRVLAPSAEERAGWASLPFDEERYRLAIVGAGALIGEPGLPVLHRLWARPTLELHGIVGGYTGEGVKTVIPPRSHRVPPEDQPSLATMIAGRARRRQKGRTTRFLRRATVAIAMQPRSTMASDTVEFSLP
jgi:acetylornithine deacetylase/succinyl-diaminopimelate desuccinylase-like protein